MTEYLFPTSVQEALALLDHYQGTALIVAGATDVMPDIRKGKRSPRCLVDVTRIAGLDQIEVTAGCVQVGAAVTFATLKDHPFIGQHVHALAEAARSVGALPIQTAATWAGNIVQAMPAADGSIAALALEAEARVVDAVDAVDGQGAVWRPVEDLFIAPGVSAVDPTRQLLTHLRFPLGGVGWGTAWRRTGRRASLVLPTLNCAAKLCLSPDGGRVERAVLALGPVAPRPYRARQAEAFLAGQPPTQEVFAEAARIAQGEANPRSSAMRASREYRLDVIPALVEEALTVAARRAINRADPC